MSTPCKLALLAVLSFAAPAAAQVGADAGQDVTVDYPSAAPLDGVVINRSPIDWWTADGNNATEDYLVKFNSVTGQSAIGPLHTAAGTHYGFPGDLVKVGNQYYGVDAAARYLYTLDPSNGLCTPVSATPYSSTYTSVHSLAYDATHDKLFAVDLARKQLLLFNRTTGFPSPIGSGTLGGYPQVRSLAYRTTDDRLYAVDQSTSMLVRLNPTTGALTPVVTVAPITNTRIEELQFFNDRLYGSQAILSSGVLVAGQLVEVDMTSGVLTNIGAQVSEVSPHCLLLNSLPEEVHWGQLAGPGTASFANASALQTTVTFSSPGIYSLEFTVYALGGAVSDTVTVISDGCPEDPNKVVAGVCGCGTPDADDDNDGMLNCLDGCPNDPSKVAPGACGCGSEEADSDGDGTPNCIDGCPNDEHKIAPARAAAATPIPTTTPTALPIVSTAARVTRARSRRASAAAARRRPTMTATARPTATTCARTIRPRRRRASAAAARRTPTATATGCSTARTTVRRSPTRCNSTAISTA
jgi:hypothetical protein